MKLLLTVASLAVSYGGPAVSVFSLGRALARAGVKVGLWTPDQSVRNIQDAGDVEVLAGPWAQAIRKFGDVDVLHDNGIWLPHNHALAVAARARRVARVASPRGMLAPWALDHKALKKKVAWWCYQKRDLVSASVLHATSEAEGADIERLRLGPRVVVIPNGVFWGEMPAPSAPRCVNGGRTALFLGRLYPVKGLPLLIDAWAKVRPPGWRLVLAGPDEQGHKAELEALIEQSRLGDVVTFAGSVAGKDKTELLNGAELFVLPSLSESFGMAIAEALAAGKPVLTTTATPWSSLATEGCGWQAPPTVEGIAAGLATATALAPGELHQMGLRGSAFAAREFNWDSLSTRFIQLYEDALRSSSYRSEQISTHWAHAPR